jgi:hypothetical protein
MLVLDRSGNPPPALCESIPLVLDGKMSNQRREEIRPAAKAIAEIAREAGKPIAASACGGARIADMERRAAAAVRIAASSVPAGGRIAFPLLGRDPAVTDGNPVGDAATAPR